MKKFIFRIEYILLFISVFNFCATVWFKNRSQEYFIQIENSLTSSDYTDVFARLEYFDKEIELQLENIASLKNQSDSSDAVVLQVLNDFSAYIRRREQLLIFSYDALLYCSLILCFIAGVVILYKISRQKNELFRLKTIHDQQIRFSRDLHDGVAQDLAALKIYLNENDVEKSGFYADQSLKEVRYLIDSMHVDLSKGFGPIIKENLSNFETNFGIRTELLIVSNNLEKIDKDILIELFRVLQEALSNIARHSGASIVRIKITEVGKDLNLIISDNGSGIDFESVKNQSRKHYGLTNIISRVTEIGGSVDFFNDGGSTIAICIKNSIH